MQTLFNGQSVDARTALWDVNYFKIQCLNPQFSRWSAVFRAKFSLKLSKITSVLLTLYGFTVHNCWSIAAASTALVIGHRWRGISSHSVANEHSHWQLFGFLSRKLPLNTICIYIFSFQLVRAEFFFFLNPIVLSKLASQFQRANVATASL